MKRILVCGLPGAGKTFLSKHLSKLIGAVHLNADELREKHNDWDFSNAGRLRQANRMKLLADEYTEYGRIVIADFVCPTQKLREEYGPDTVIFVDTIDESRYADTNKIFEAPANPDFHITKKLKIKEIEKLAEKLQNE